MEEAELMKAFYSLWNNRILPAEDDSNSLFYAIKTELLDEQAHPRVRVSIETKFYYGVKRIANSTLGNKEKLALIQRYIAVVDEINNRN